LASQSADRTCRIFAKAPNKQKYSSYSTLRNIEIPNESKNKTEQSETKAQDTIIPNGINTTTTTKTTSTTNDLNGNANNSITTTTTEPIKPDVTKHKMFGEEAVNTFFRRLCWTVDGSLLLVPFGKLKKEKCVFCFVS